MSTVKVFSASEVSIVSSKAGVVLKRREYTFALAIKSRSWMLRRSVGS
jgi:ketosteroid isomerase-like protein